MLKAGAWAAWAAWAAEARSAVARTRLAVVHSAAAAQASRAVPVFPAAPRSRALAPPLGNPDLRLCRAAPAPAGELRVERVFRSALLISWRQLTATHFIRAGRAVPTSVRWRVAVSERHLSEQRRVPQVERQQTLAAAD